MSQEIKIVSKDKVREGEEPVTTMVGNLTEVIDYMNMANTVLVIVVEKLGGSDIFHLYRIDQLKVREEQQNILQEQDTVSQESQEEEKVDEVKEVSKRVKYVKATPEKILKGVKCRCIVGSDAGMEGVVVSVTRPGVRDCETFRLGDSKLPPDCKSITPLFPIPDGVRIMYTNPKDDETTNKEGGATQNFVGKNVGVTTTKKQFCDNWKIKIEE
jgi:hypothetical protein